jgi:cell division protein FtsB
MYLKYTLNKEKGKTSRLVEKNKKLEKEIKLLKDDNGYIEYIARRDLGLVKSQDIIYFFKDKNEENQR